MLDERGEPVPGLVVYLQDPVLLGRAMSTQPLTAEHPKPSRYGAHAMTDENGGFRIAGVLPRAYRLRLYEPRSHWAITTAPIAPGGVPRVLQVPGRRERAEIRGRVVDGLGRALANVRIEPLVVIRRVGEPGGTSASVRAATHAQDGVSDEHGRFALRRVPAGEVELDLSRVGLIDRTIEIQPGAEGPLLVSMSRRVLIRVDAAGVDHHELKLQLHDADGRAVEVESPPGVDNIDPRVYYGRSVVLATASHARTARLVTARGQTVREMPVDLRGDGIAVLAFP